MLKTCFLAPLLALAGSAAQAQTPPAETLLLREPALSRDKLAFSYAGDIWTANRDGSNPQRLTVGPGVETSPRFSPDGQLIACTGDYDRNADVYVVAVSGGQPRRLTWHPSAEAVCDSTPDCPGCRPASANRRERLCGSGSQWLRPWRGCGYACRRVACWSGPVKTCAGARG